MWANHEVWTQLTSKSIPADPVHTSRQCLALYIEVCSLATSSYRIYKWYKTALPNSLKVTPLLKETNSFSKGKEQGFHSCGDFYIYIFIGLGLHVDRSCPHLSFSHQKVLLNISAILALLRARVLAFNMKCKWMISQVLVLLTTEVFQSDISFKGKWPLTGSLISCLIHYYETYCV